MKTIRFTKEGLDKIRTEYENLLLERKPAVQTLKAARELGDLSENGLYHAAKANLRSIDGRIRRLSNMIKLAEVISLPKITVEENRKRTVYEIVGDFEANPSKNKISANSPIGRSILGRKAGDKVEIQTPSGKRLLTILRVY